jgi:hypothetical protein
MPVSFALRSDDRMRRQDATVLRFGNPAPESCALNETAREASRDLMPVAARVHKETDFWKKAVRQLGIKME